MIIPLRDEEGFCRRGKGWLVYRTCRDREKSLNSLEGVEVGVGNARCRLRPRRAEAKDGRYPGRRGDEYEGKGWEGDSMSRRHDYDSEGERRERCSRSPRSWRYDEESEEEGGESPRGGE